MKIEVISLIWLLSATFFLFILQQAFFAHHPNLAGANISHFKHTDDKTFFKFQFSYLTVYCLAMFSDWLHGPYIYFLYASYGYNPSDIGLIFVLGFASSGVFGVITGKLADKYGRKKACMTYCASYLITSICYNFNHILFLAVGRIFGGIATSLLFSSFDSWLLSEHTQKKKYPPEYINIIYSRAAFLNGVIAILAGVFSSFLVYWHGPIAPFNVSIFFLLLCWLLIIILWEENIPTEELDVRRGTRNEKWSTIYEKILGHPEIWWTGLIQAIFEAVLYSFVLFWTPSLPESFDRGLVFASFMTAVMLGSRISQILEFQTCPGSIQVMFYLVLALISMIWSSYAIKHTLWNQLLIAFCTFEVTCGMHYTSFYILRGRYVLPEKNRATILNLFRVPLNAIVIIVCITWADYKLHQLMLGCSILLGVSIFFTIPLHIRLKFKYSQEKHI